MAVDPNELLIFRMRGKVVNKEEEKEVTKKEIVEHQTAEVTQVAGEANRIMTEVKPEEVAKIQTAPALLIRPELEEKNKAVFNQLKSEVKEERNREQREVLSKKMKKTKKVNIEAAKGLICVNHPWRPAYAVCNDCERPFCYADLVTYGNNFYCLEDIDKVSLEAASKARSPSNIFITLAAVLFLANAVVLANYLYPQSLLLLKDLYQIFQLRGMQAVLSSLNYTYEIEIANVVIVIFGLIASVLTMSRSEKGYFISIVGASLMIIMLSYEFLSSNINYLLIVTLITFVNVALLAISGMSSINVVKEEEGEIRPNDIEWPRVETF